jgi:PAS domain S-box-containing protein
VSIPSNTRLLPRFRSFSRCAGLAAAATGVFVLFGWALDNAILKSVLPDVVSMKPNTAACFLMAGLSLFLVARESSPGGRDRSARLLSRIGAAAVTSLGVLTLAEFATGWDLRIDQLLFVQPLGIPASVYPGRMAINTSINFILVGAALLWINRETRRGSRPSEWMSLLVGCMAWIAFVWYAYRIKFPDPLVSFTSMAIYTAAAFMLLAAGIACARPERGVMALVTSGSMGGLITRRMLPVALLVPAFAGWLCVEGQQAQLYGTEFGMAIFSTTNILFFVLFIFVTSRQIDQFDARRKRAEVEINRLFTFSQDLLCVAGFDGYFKRLNPAWENTLGHTLDELMARPYAEFLHPEDRARTQAEAGRLADGQVTVAFENRYQAKDGSYKWLFWNSYPVPEERLIYGSAREITLRKEAEEQVRVLNDALEQQVADLDASNRELEATNKELEAFSYSVSHDLRAPLRHIDGFSRILEDEYGSQFDSTASHYLRRIRQGTRHMGELVDDLLSLSRVGRQELRRQLTGLNSLVEEVRAELKEIAAQSGRQRSVEWKIAPLPFADCDPALMKQVFANLLSNAVKYTLPRQQAIIEVSSTTQNGETVLFVRDNGVGFSMKYADKLFGVFQRLHRQEDFEGTGVGLATVQRILRKHGGRIWAEAELDRGACFYFTVEPAATESSESTAPATAAMSG